MLLKFAEGFLSLFVGHSENRSGAQTFPAPAGHFPIKREFVWVKRKGFLFKFVKPARRHAELYFDGRFTLRTSEDPSSTIIFSANVRDISVELDAEDPLLLHLMPTGEDFQASRFSQRDGGMEGPCGFVPGRTASADSTSSIAQSPVSASAVLPAFSLPISRACSAPGPPSDATTPRIVESSPVSGKDTGAANRRDPLRHSSFRGVLMKLKNIGSRRAWMSAIIMRQSLLERKALTSAPVTGELVALHLLRNIRAGRVPSSNEEDEYSETAETGHLPQRVLQTAVGQSVAGVEGLEDEHPQDE